MDGCEQYRSFLAERGMDEAPPPGLAAHAERCPACARLREAYVRSVGDLRSEAPRVAPPLPDVSRVLAAARAGRARARWRRAGLAAAVATAAAVAVALGAWQVAVGPGPDVPPRAADEGRGAAGLVAGPEVTGAAMLASADGTEVPVAGAAVVPEGRTVRTGDGEALLSDPATARVAVGSQTRVRVVRWRPERTVLWLDEGALEAQVLPRAPGEVFEVRTSDAVVRVVGTRFRVTHRAGAGTEIVGLEGEVAVEGPDGALVANVTAGRSVRLGADPAVETSPAQILAPPARRAATRSPVEAQGDVEAVVPDAVVAEARRLLADGRDAEAVALLRQAVEASATGDSARMLAALAEAYRLAGRPGEAAAAWEQCLAAGPGPAPETAYVEYADLLASQGRSGEAARVREAYLRAWPGGRHLGRVLQDLATFAEREGRAGDAAELRRRLVRDAPRSGEAVEAFVELGLRMARAGDLEGAAAWFDGRRQGDSRELAEAAWVGLLRVRFEAGRFDEVRALAGEYDHRFPVGTRRAEVARLVRALPRPTAP